MRSVGIRRAALALIAPALACGACGIAPAPGPELTSYDFGPAPEQAARSLHQAVVVHEIGAPAWLDSPLMHYRLAYRDAARPKAYADSRWVMSPAALLSNRLRRQLAASGTGGVIQPGDGAHAKYALRVELDEFMQVFDAPGRSRGVVRMRAVVIGNRSLVAQRTFKAEQPAPTPDAEGGARALTAASDEAIDQLVAWTIQNVKD